MYRCCRPSGVRAKEYVNISEGIDEILAGMKSGDADTLMMGVHFKVAQITPKRSLYSYLFPAARPHTPRSRKFGIRKGPY
jgi:hypothetical protein